MCRRSRKCGVFLMQRTNRSFTWKVCFRRGRTANQGITKVSFPSPKASSLELDKVEKLQVYWIRHTRQLLEKSSSSHHPLQNPEKVIFLCIKLSPVNRHVLEELSYQGMGGSHSLQSMSLTTLFFSICFPFCPFQPQISLSFLFHELLTKYFGTGNQA